jgi:hypothetical protein
METRRQYTNESIVVVVGIYILLGGLYTGKRLLCLHIPKPILGAKT